MNLIETIQKRQERVMSTLPSYTKNSITWAIVLYVTIILVQILKSGNLSESYAILGTSVENPIGFVVTHLLGAFSGAVLYLYLIWSLTFIPFIGFKAYRASEEFRPNLVISAGRWLQLYGAILLPCFLFAIAWSSTTPAAPDKIDSALNIVRIQSMYDGIVVSATAVFTMLVFYIAHKLVPRQLTTVRLSLLSVLLYTSVFFTYRKGVGLAAFGLVMGSLVYIMFWSQHFSDLLRQIVMHDIEPRQIAEYEDIIALHNDSRMISDQSSLLKEKHRAEMNRMGFDLDRDKQKGEHDLNKQLVDIKNKKSVLNKQINATQIEMMQKKIRMLQDLFGSVSAEMSARIDATIPKRLEEVKENLRNMTPDEINEKMTVLMQEIDECMKGMPEKLDQLRDTLLSTTKQLEDQTKLLVEEPDIKVKRAGKKS